MADTENSTDWWDKITGTVTDVGGLILDYKKADSKNEADNVSDLPPTTNQQAENLTPKNNNVFLGIDFSQPKNIIATVGLILISIIVIKKV